MPFQMVLLRFLGAVVAAILLFGLGYHYGGKHQRNADAADQLAGVNAAVTAGRLQSQAESAIAIQEAEKQAKSRNARRIAADALTTEVAADETARHCRLSGPAYQRLLDLYRSADATDPPSAAGGGHGALPAAADARRADPGGFSVKYQPAPAR